MAETVRDTLLKSAAQVDANNGDFGAISDSIGKRFPTLAPHLKNTVFQWGKDQGDGRQLEFYPPWESENPNPGKVTLEFYNRNPDGGIENAAAADLLHHVGAVDPSTGQPVDPTFHGFKQQVIGSFTPEQQSINQNAYKEAQGDGERRPFDDWMQQSRADAYMRAGVFPEQNPEWRGFLSPDQQTIMQQATQYLQGQR